MLQQPVILCGLGRVGRRVIDYLRAARVAVVAIDRQPPTEPLPADVRVVIGDCRSPHTLETAGIRDAGGVVVCTSDDLANLAAAMAARSLNPHARIVVRLFNPTLVPRLGSAVANVVALSVSALTAPLLAMIASTGNALAAFDAPDGPRQIAEVSVTADGPLAGLTVRDAGDRYRLLVLAHLLPDADARVLYAVEGGRVLTPGDRLVACAAPHDLAALHDSGQPPAVLWAGWLRRGGRMFGRAAADLDPAVVATLAALVVVVGGSAILFHVTSAIPWAGAVYRTVSVMATVGDMHAEAMPGWLQLYASGLRLAGAALTAATTALLTNYLLRARLGGALEARRIPDGGHFVVCGLGNLGFRICEELLRARHKVVVIERDREGRFLTSARRAGAAVIVADASLPAVLRQARVGSARAVIAATGNELANIEIALLVREGDPGRRVVVRIADLQFAQALRDAAGVKLAFSVPALAAPAFVAALFGDTVHAVFRVAGELFAAVDLAVAEGDPCLDGQSVRAVTLDYDLLPVSLATARPSRQQWLGHTLAAGDRLTAVGRLDDFDRLFRREPPPRDRAVEVRSVPLTARDCVAGLLHVHQQLSADDAARMIDLPSFVLCRRLTRGQADDLCEQLARERVAADSIPLPG